MTFPRIISTVVTSALLATTMASFDEQSAVGAPPSQFGQLLKIGETVLLRPSTTHPVYTVQLLSSAQAMELQSTATRYTALRSQRDEFAVQLATAKDLNDRAALFVEYRTLVAEINDITSTARLEIYAYEVSHVGTDYVTLTKPGRERYIPLGSIRELHRSETLESRPSNIGRRSAANPTEPRTSEFRLKYVPAEKVIALVNQFYPDLATNLEADVPSKLVRITADELSLRLLNDFVETLDAISPDAPARRTP